MRKQTKTTLVLVAVLVVVVAGFGYNRYRVQQQKQNTQSEKDFIADFDVSTVTAVQIVDASATTDLKKDGTQWYVVSADNAAADGDAVERLIAAVDNTMIETVVSRNGNNLATYGLDDPAKLLVKISLNSGQIVEMTVGKTGSLPQTFYAMRPSDSAVYLVSGAQYVFSKTDWKKPAETNDSAATDTNVDAAE
ncbi:MAG: DUF4340 domain-containing protein [Candidatus Kerfeldbacteria bacterium]|nr:DUF4340 domain-containing protein [Candidatus Kerfeldbacteria bacterium]